ncbi:MAG: hypothetical protein CVU04_04700 [Bacteroidetes bacterium HGW-Bacteroidetes-20]|nr:MAG: hypothetical protein CVU04_04700 [Bacteroidetes bacterium HGW-Bacteroidetes-20]
MIPRFFKKEKNTNKAEEIRQFLPVNVNTNFDNLASAIYMSENKYILPLLGQKLFDTMVSFYNEATHSGDHIKIKEELLNLIQFSLIRIAYWHEFPVLSITLSDAGASDKAGENARLFKYQEENLKSSLKNTAFDVFDMILSLCESNSEAFPLFAESPYMVNSAKTLIKKTSDFEKVFSINSSRLVFLKMRQYIQKIEQIDLIHKIGSEFFAELLNSLDPEILSVKELIQFYIVNASIGEGITQLHQMPTERGMVFIRDNSSDVAQSAIIEYPQLMQTGKEHTQTAERYINDAISLMLKNPVKFKKFIDFHGVQKPNSQYRDNNNKKTFLT